MLIHGLGEEGCYMLHVTCGFFFLMDRSRAVLESLSAMVRSWAGINFELLGGGSVRVYEGN